ncbi:DUF3466 family protein [Psychromonas sp. KJ10-10]|uniref:DUF3466 family protein n=1 Tax=Psychromonas sp. KJ10-10 TaxID=3391823 RepID=UPI0039B6274C
MKLKVTVASLILLMADNVLAQDEPYFTIETINVTADNALYGPYPKAMSEDEDFIATNSTKASISSNIDIGLPFTFNKECQYDSVLCELQFYGSESSELSSYYNAYKAWRNAQADADDGSYESYMMANTLSSMADNGMVLPFDLGGNTTDVTVTDVYTSSAGVNYIIGHSSGPYSDGERDFVRRAFIQSLNGTVVSLMPEFTTDGGFSSAYKIKEVGDTVIVVGASSRSFPEDDDEYFDYCFNSDETDDVYDINDLVYCPGFDTQAWAWDVTDIVNNGATDTELTGSALATTWLDDNTENQDYVTYSANAFDINASETAVGTSTFEYSNSAEGARQRATLMKPTDGVYGEAVEITAVTDDIGDQEDSIYNTWALTISDAGLVTGNREYNAVKSRNQAIEFFVYDSTTDSISFPLLNKKVANTEQRLENDSYFVSKNGANSRIYDANESNWFVGEVDDYDQTDPVYGASPREQAAFLFDNSENQGWLINDLICSQTDGVVTSPYIRITTARVISENNVVLADGYVYENNDDYTNRTNGVQTAFKLTPNSALSPNDSPNCWESDLHSSDDDTYEREGGATFWLWIFTLPLVFIRRFYR